MSTLALPQAKPLTPVPKARMSPWRAWGLIMLVPYVLVFLVFVLYPVVYGLWLARDPANYVELFNDPIFGNSVLNTLIFLIVAINLKMLVALLLSGFFVTARPWIKWLSVLFILPWAVPSIPTILSIRFMLNPEWGVVNQVIFRLLGEDGPNWLNDRWLALTMAMLVHVWKSLPFWTMIMIAGRLAISKDLYEAAGVDGASKLQQFRFITWPSMQTLYLTSTILSMIWTLGDFNSVYLSDRRRAGGPDAHPRDDRHPLPAARPDQPVDGDDRLRDAARIAARLLHDEAPVALTTQRV